MKDPREVVSPGDRVSVRVLEVKLDKQQIALSMRSGSTADVARGPRPGEQDRRGGGPNAARAPSRATATTSNVRSTTHLRVWTSCGESSANRIGGRPSVSRK